jgi:hypothetical protein
MTLHSPAPSLQPPPSKPRLRLLRSFDRNTLCTYERTRTGAFRIGRTGCCVLLAGADAGQRALLRRDLSLTLPRETVFLEASEVWEVVQLAPNSRMVMLSGDLADMRADALTRLLGRRHPWLPVLSLAEEHSGRSVSAHTAA